MNDYLATRTTGQYPLSIATSLALESLYGIYPDRPVHPPPALKYAELWINVRTLFRNLLGSMERGAEAAIGENQMADGLYEEMEMIESIVREKSPYLKVVFYAPEYRSLASRYPNANLRYDTTDKQQQYRILMDNSIRALLGGLEDKGRVRVFDLDLIPLQPAKTVMLTHYAFDLLSSPNFGDLDLLESHTGAIKTKDQWYTKFSNGKDLSAIPFRASMLQIFGDSELFRPASSLVRKTVIELSEKYRWSNVTTLERIRLSVSLIPDLKLKAEIQKYL